MRTCIAALACALGTALASPPPPDATGVAITAIVRDSQRSAEEKLDALESYLPERPTHVLHMLEGIEKGEGVRRGMRLFRSAGSSRFLRLTVGHELVARLGADEFVSEFADFLATAVQDHGIEEYAAIQDGTRRTAVGELAYSAGAFEGVPEAVFTLVAQRVPRDELIAILDKCLDAPDWVYGQDQGCIFMGPPGQPSGRNITRQLLPLALARLDAAESVPRLMQVVKGQEDTHLRSNAIYAIARAGTPAQVEEVKAWTLDHRGEVAHGVFELGRGLLERGDPLGVMYLRFRYDSLYGSNDVSSLLYMLERRLDVLEKAGHPKVVELYREALEYRPMRKLWLFEGDELPLDIESRYWSTTFSSGDEVLQRHRERITKDYARLVAAIRKGGHADLETDLAQIARETHDDEIRRLSSR